MYIEDRKYVLLPKPREIQLPLEYLYRKLLIFVNKVFLIQYMSIVFRLVQTLTIL